MAVPVSERIAVQNPLIRYAQHSGWSTCRWARRFAFAMVTPDCARRGARGASYRLAGVAAEALPMTGITSEDSSPYAQPSSGDVKLNSGDAQPSSADTQPSSADTQRNSADVKPSSGDDAFISQYVSRLSKEKQRQLVEVAKTIMGKRNATRSMRDEVIPNPSADAVKLLCWVGMDCGASASSPAGKCGASKTEWYYCSNMLYCTVIYL